MPLSLSKEGMDHGRFVFPALVMLDEDKACRTTKENSQQRGGPYKGCRVPVQAQRADAVLKHSW
jgi:hypothetical protein